MDDGAEQRWEETAAAVAHELGTPLTVAQAALHALVRSTTDAHVEELAEAALRSMRSMELQVARLRRLEGASADDLQLQRTDLVALASELVADLDGSLLHDHPTSIEAPDELIVTVDPDQIRHVLYNLLSNAAKYSPPDLDLIVSMASTDDGGVVLRVHDRGHGVAPEDADRIFDKYERAHDGPPGAGLGLYLARLVVEAHGGTLRLVPAEGEGAVFELRLPSGGATGAGSRP